MRGRRTLVAQSLVVLAAAAAPWLMLGACSYDWERFDPRIEPLGTGVGAGGEATTTTTRPTGGSGGSGARGGSAGTGGSGGGDPHVTPGLVALYTLEEGSGSIVEDVSGVGSPLDLTIADPANAAWIDGGLDIINATIVASSGPATKIIDACKSSGELTAEVWFVPDNLVQDGPARLVTSSLDPSFRNFTLGQEADEYLVARFRTDGADGGLNGYPYMYTPGSTVKLELTHLLFTRDAAGERHLYVDGIDYVTDEVPGALSSWDDTHPFALANEPSLDRAWLGELHRVAIYNRALTAAEAVQNYGAGP